MKKTFFSCITLFLLVSCGGTTSTWLTPHETPDFTMDIPQNWVVFGEGSNAIPKPKVWEIALAVSSTESTGGFSNNLLILKETLSKETTSQRFAMLNNFGVAEDYEDYESKEEKDITFNDDEPSKLYIFTAKYNSKTPKLTFLQTARVCKGNVGFFLTIALPANITDVAKYEEILKTFACK